MTLVRRGTETPPAGEQRERPRDPAALVAALQNPNPDVRRWAALDLDGETSAVAPLAARLAGETDQAVREALLNTLAGIGGPDVVGALISHLRSEDATLRNAAVDCLGQIPAAADAVPSLIDDDDAAVRSLAVTLVASLHDPRVPGWLLGVIATDPDANVCGAAIGELADVGDETACSLIETAAARFPSDPFMAFAARTAVARLTGSR
ncbi:MAG: HEAT repeat domain-containing protein [Solirubrobacteraceae bacterium]